MEEPNKIIRSKAINEQTNSNKPITMLCFAWIVMYKYFVAPVFGTPDINLVPEFWQLLKIGVGGYVGGRSLEKIADTVTKNIDMPFLKKKDRQEIKKRIITLDVSNKILDVLNTKKIAYDHYILD